MANPTIWPTPPICTKGALDRAGASLMDALARPEDLDLVNRWRAAHGFPLNTFQTNLRYRARTIDNKAVVAQRLKRFVSIRAKLQREPSMRLSQMQDIGGCRAVVRTVKSVSRLTQWYLEDESFRLRNDYIVQPKSDGYRSIHLIGSYHTDSPEHAVWNGHKIEVQIRTQLQHAWATALEVVMTFTNEPLKFGEGDPVWLRFFALMGSAIATREKTPLAAEVAFDAEELRKLAAKLRVIERLTGWRNSMKFMPKRRMVGAEAWLLILSPKGRTLHVRPYRTLAEAAEVALKYEKYKTLDVVQVRAESLDELRSGYRNYYADTRDFVTALRKAIT